MSNEEEIEEDENESYLHPQWRIFSTAYADPGSPTYGDKGKSYRVAYPLKQGQEETEITTESARRAAYKLLARDVVVEEIERIRLAVRGAIGMLKDDYLKLLLKREELYATRAGKGDAMASANILKLIGQAGGFLVIKKEDVTPPERRLPSGEQATAAILAAADRLRRLQQPAKPQPLLSSVEEAPITIVEDERPRCAHCEGRRVALYLEHWTQKPTCRVCDEILSAEKRRRERERERQGPATEGDGGDTAPGNDDRGHPGHP